MSQLDHNRIAFSDITFVVQGSVIGLPADSLENRHTAQCLKSIRRHFPGATIILSTWENAVIDDLDYDLLVQSSDPGAFVLVDGNPNGARHIISSANGLFKVKTAYVAKVRSDLVFENSNFLSYFSRYVEQPRDNTYKVFSRRVLTLTTCNPRRRHAFPFTVSDWFYFGTTEDVRALFSIPVIKNPTVYSYAGRPHIKVDTLLSGEQYIWTSYLRMQGRSIPLARTDDATPENIELSERYLANNIILLPARRAGIDWLKFPGAAYAQIPALSNTGLYTLTEYEHLLASYAGANIFIFPNLVEAIVYRIVYLLRGFLERRTPGLWNRIRRTVNYQTHKRLDAMRESQKKQ